MKYKVGDRVARLDEERYSQLGPKDSPMWTGTVVKVKLSNYIVLCDDGRRVRWSPEYFRHLTKLEQALK